MRRFDELATEIARGLKAKNAILDGEIVVLDEAGRPKFKELLLRRGTPYFVAFDLLWVNGKDLRGLALLRRKEHLKNLIVGETSIGYVSHYPFAGKALFDSVKTHDLEGIVAKRMNSRYDASATWYKIRTRSTPNLKNVTTFSTRCGSVRLLPLLVIEAG